MARLYSHFKVHHEVQKDDIRRIIEGVSDLVDQVLTKSLDLLLREMG